MRKCASGAAENLRISKFKAYIGRVAMHIFYCIFVQFIRFPAHDFGLDYFASRPFNSRPTFFPQKSCWSGNETTKASDFEFGFLCCVPSSGNDNIAGALRTFLHYHFKRVYSIRLLQPANINCFEL